MRTSKWVWVLLGVACAVPPKAGDQKEPTKVADPNEPAVDAEPAVDEADEASPAKTGIAASRAWMLSRGKLMLLAPTGTTEVVADAAEAIECRFDESHGVVWLVSGEAVRAYDPADGAVHDIASGIPRPNDGLDWQIQRSGAPSPFPLVTASNVTGIEACVSLVVFVGDKPRVGGEIIAEGDREWYCFANDTDVGKDREDQTLNVEQAAVKARYDKAQLSAGPFLVALSHRFEKDGPVARPKLEAPPMPHPVLDKARCEENESDCGRAEYLGGQRIWRVITSNSRGDFYHEGTSIYDSKTSSWWAPSIDKHTAKLEEVEGAGLASSPDGTWGVSNGRILSLTDAKVIGTFAGSPCGWE